MAKLSKKKGAKRGRSERRFEPRSTANPLAVKLGGALGALAMGAGTYGQFGPAMHTPPDDPIKYATWILAGGAALLGAAIWLGTSGEPTLRVGDPGIAVEKSGLRRIAWHAVERVELAEGAVRATGKDDLGRALTVVASLASQPQAAAWIVKEARARVPAVVEIGEDAALPDALADGGELLAVDPPQVVGKHCANSGKIIAYEPDARICPKCERVYHKAHVPDACPCGASLVHLQPRAKSA